MLVCGVFVLSVRCETLEPLQIQSLQVREKFFFVSMMGPGAAATRFPDLIWKLLLMLFLLSHLTCPAMAVDSESDAGGEVQWQILTKLNFSSQIRAHPHLLLMVTVPWSGESRALMRDLSREVAMKPDNFSTLKLMLLYRNVDRMLAELLGATEDVTLFYYHHSSHYKYQGRLRVKNVLLSVQYVMSLLPEDLPLKSLSTSEELKLFLESTDKALLLMEFCGWTPKVLAKLKSNVSENAFGMAFNGETQETHVADLKKNQWMETERMNCGIDSGLGAIPWLSDPASINRSDALQADDTRGSDGVFCNFEGFKEFESILLNLTAVAQEFFLPPDRIKFGLVHERSLLSSLGVGDPGPWFMTLYYAGCPDCSKVLKQAEDLKRMLQIHGPPVAALEFEDHGLEPALPSNKPSMILFIDRSSDSLKTRRESKEALDVFREVALHHQTSYPMNENSTAKSHKLSEHNQVSRTMLDHPRFFSSLSSQKVSSLENAMSITLVNKGKHVTSVELSSDLQGRSLHEILAHVLRPKKERKFSSLAKDVGFQLLSDDFDVKPMESVSERVIEPNLEHGSFDEDPGVIDEEHQRPQLTDTEHSFHQEEKPSLDTNKAMTVEHGSFDEDPGVIEEEHQRPQLTDTEHSFHQEERPSLDPNKAMTVEPVNDQHEQVFTSEGSVKEEIFPPLEASFFFADGHFRFLKALTGASKFPSLVIIDPISEKHYVLPNEATFSYFSMSNFLDKFKNRSLIPHQQSESVILDPRESPLPPLVNKDFHEVDSIPRISADMFLELVVGNKSNFTGTGNARKDMLVLLSGSWCGFCQRMELVVREVYRAIKGYGKMVDSGSLMSGKRFVADDKNSVISRLPHLYVMDCTLNDCSLILKSLTQRVLYPSLLLFPAESKESIPYRGDMSVTEIIKFIADHGSDSHWLLKERDFLFSEIEKKDASKEEVQEEAPLVKRDNREILFTERSDKIPITSVRVKPRASYDPNKTGHQVVSGSILIATEKLQNVNPFDGSKILIVRANTSTGFQGLITNKPLSWDSLNELEGLQILKEAPLWFGGPVIIRGMPLVALTQKHTTDRYLEVVPNVYFLDQWATLNLIERVKLGNESIDRYWFFLGYSNWGWDQLFDEIDDGAWHVGYGDLAHFDWPPTS